MIPGMTPPLRPPVKSLDDATVGRSGPHFGLSGQSSDWVALPTHSYGPGQFLLRVRVPSPQVVEQSSHSDHSSNSPEIKNGISKYKLLLSKC